MRLKKLAPAAIPFLTLPDERARFAAAKWFDDWTSLAPVGSLSGQERAEADWPDAANRRHDRGGCRCDACSERESSVLKFD